MQSTHIANMNLPKLSSAAKIGHVLLNPSSASLLSIGQLCDDTCLALFTKEKVFIFKKNYVCKENEIILMVCGLFQSQFNLYQFHHQTLQRKNYYNTPTIILS